jgi:hypothetical protein
MKPREIGWENVDVINIAQDVGKFQALVKTIKKFQILWNACDFWKSDEMLGSQVVLCSMKVAT